MTFRLCDDGGEHGFGWIAAEAQTRTSHALAADGRLWLVDVLDWPEAIERALALGEPAGVIQLLDRHKRDCAALAERLSVPHIVAPDGLADTPFSFVPVKRSKRWRETALWWAERRTLVLADALGTNPFFTGGTAPLGVHLLLRLTPPRVLDGFEPEHVLVGHGDGVHGPGAAPALRKALTESRRRLPAVLLRLPLVAYRGSQPTSMT